MHVTEPPYHSLCFVLFHSKYQDHPAPTAVLPVCWAVPGLTHFGPWPYRPPAAGLRVYQQLPGADVCLLGGLVWPDFLAGFPGGRRPATLATGAAWSPIEPGQTLVMPRGWADQD